MTPEPAENPGIQTRPPRTRTPLPNLALGMAERRLLLGVMDSLSLSASLAVALTLDRAPASTEALVGHVAGHWAWFVLLVLIWLVAAAILDAYDLKTASNAFTSPFAALKALLATSLAYLFVLYVSPPVFQSPLAWLLLFLLAVGLVVTWRIVYASVFVQPVFQRKALIVGVTRAGIDLLQTLQARSSGDYRVCGFIDDDPAKQGVSVEGCPVLGTSQDLLSVIRREGVAEVISAITDSHAMSDPLFDAIMNCHEQGIQVTTMPAVYENVTGRVAVEHIGRQLNLLLPLDFSSTRRIYETSKRLADVVGALGGLAAFALCLPFIAAAIKLDTRGPVFHAQERVGKGGRVFRVFKLRSMIVGAEAPGQAVWATENDVRITRVGKFLRRVRLDEFPQFANVLRGEMSLIGPRPERPQFVAELAEQIPFYRARHTIKPGITGWAQIKYRYGYTVEDALIKLQYDLYYIKRRSVYLDLLILAKTVLVMLSFKGT